MIRPALPGDADAIASIYNHYVSTTVISFEEQAVRTHDMAARIAAVQAATLPWLVYEDAAHGVIGYAYAGKWKERSAYRHAVETSVYLHRAHTGNGVGTQLYAHLLALLREAGLHTAIGGIALPNQASVRLHEQLGFEPVARFREVGHKFGRRIDVGYWQRLL
jgi:phosphinothricin acetyltransferase